jgi:CheY-like chemotaxis protein
MSKKILIVDDEPQLLNMIKKRLEGNNYQVITANDGRQGIDKAKNERPDLIVIDIMMPHMDGGTAVRKLKEDVSTNKIPVIFLTAVVTKKEEEVQQGVNIDNTSYPAIAKPIDPEKFLRKIREVLGE